MKSLNFDSSFSYQPHTHHCIIELHETILILLTWSN